MGFTSIPNELDDSNLDAYQFRVLVRIKRRGVCYESQRSMAASMNMSPGKVNSTIKWLLDNGWIVKKVSESTNRLGYSAVSPDEQVQQNCITTRTDVSPHERSVSPHERHLKNNLEEVNNNKTREDETLIAFFEGMTSFTRPHDTTDGYADDWLAPTQAILKQSANFGEAEKRLTWAIQEMRRKRYTIKSPKSCLTMALNWHDPSLPNGQSNGRIDKSTMKGNLWTIVTRSKNYKDAMGRASPDEQQLLKAMGKWRDVRGLNEKTFSIRFYEAYKNGNH